MCWLTLGTTTKTINATTSPTMLMSTALRTSHCVCVERSRVSGGTSERADGRQCARRDKCVSVWDGGVKRCAYQCTHVCKHCSDGTICIHICHVSVCCSCSVSSCLTCVVESHSHEVLRVDCLQGGCSVEVTWDWFYDTWTKGQCVPT